MTEKEYRSHPAISRSELWKIKESPEKFKWYKENPPSPTPTLIFGQFLHALVLTPDAVNNDFIMMPNFDRRTKQGKEEYEAFISSVGDRTPISTEMYALGLNMANAIEKHPIASKLIKGKTELPLFWTDEQTGEECKCRLDVIRKAKERLIVVDLKTTEDASTEAFVRSMVNYGYDFQAAMYSEGVKKHYGVEPLFVFVVIEKKEPFAINVLQADENVLRRGYDLYRELLGIYHECKITNNWYGYLGESQIINSLSLPAWLAKEVE